MASVHDWSTSAGSNATADAAINWAEGMLPSGVNNSSRQMMARIAERLSDESPIRTSTGAANLYSFNITSPIATYQTGLKVCFLAHQANAGDSQISINGIGFKPLRRVSGVALASAAINASKGYTANYILATDEFLLEGSDLDGSSLNSPAFTGVPTAPTATAGNSTTQLATTAFVSGAVNTLSTSVTNSLALKANLASPTFTGTPDAPTAAAATNNTQIASTAHVKAYVATYFPAKLSTAIGTAPSYSIRAWVRIINGASTPAISNDENVTSITDMGVGLYRINFTTAAPAATYAVAVTAVAGVEAAVGSRLTTSCEVDLTGRWQGAYDGGGLPVYPAADSSDVSAIFIW